MTFPPVSRRRAALLLALLSLLTAGARGADSPAARPQAAATTPNRVFIVVMDGLRRDAVVPEDMPTLSALAKSGTFFAAHHPAYPSTTEVNGTALATGQTPARSGVMANREYRPDVELLRAVDTQDEWAQWTVDHGSAAGAPGWIRTPTLPELARAAGMRTAVAGTKGVGIMWDRGFKNRTLDSPTVFDGKSIPSAFLDNVHEDLGPFPPGPNWKHLTNDRRDEWTTRVLVEKMWAGEVPQLSILWLSEPDFSQHGTGPGSAQSRAALKGNDKRLAAALAALEKKGVRDRTNVIVTSDHGFSTIYRSVDVPASLRKAGFKAEGEFSRSPEKGSVMVVGLGGGVSLYVIGPKDDPAVAATRDRLTAHLQASDWAGVIFTRDGGPGTFKLTDVGIASPDAPDVFVSLKWKDEQKKDRMPGIVVATGGDVGQGTHGTLSRYDMTNTLIAAGPDFKAGLRNTLPSANTDVAPTVAHVLGLRPPADHPMEGRVLAEALVKAPAMETPKPPHTEVLQAQRTLRVEKPKPEPATKPAGTTKPAGKPDAKPAAAAKPDPKPAKPEMIDKQWSQYLKVTTYAGRRYFDEGNTGAPPAEQ